MEKSLKQTAHVSEWIQYASGGNTFPLRGEADEDDEDDVDDEAGEEGDEEEDEDGDDEDDTDEEEDEDPTDIDKGGAAKRTVSGGGAALVSNGEYLTVGRFLMTWRACRRCTAGMASAMPPFWICCRRVLR